VMGDVIEAASRCNVCTSRTETALRGLKQVQGLEGKAGLEWITSKAKKFSNNVKSRVDDFMFNVLGVCVGRNPTPARLQWCEDMVNWRGSNGNTPKPKVYVTCAANSFTRETLVSTRDGLTAISNLRQGNLVLGFNELERTDEVRDVLQVYENLDSELTRLTLTSEQGIEVLETTPGHPFFLRDRSSGAGERWVEAGKLEVGDTLQRIGGGIGSVREVVNYRGSRVMFNLSVRLVQSYFVGRGRWLVHNQTPCLLTYDEWRKIIGENFENGISGQQWQVNHLFQDAAFGDHLSNGLIKYSDGPAIPLLGSTSTYGTQHWAFHFELEEFWDYWRATDQKPTFEQYIVAVDRSLIKAGLDDVDAALTANAMREWIQKKGIGLDGLIPNVPDEIPFIPGRPR
jgi:hypothetical protein